MLALVLTFLVMTGGLVLAVRAMRRRFAVVLVRGASMRPALEPGDRALVRRGGRQIRVGDIVIFREPPWAAEWDGEPVVTNGLAPGGWVVKRVAALAGDPVPPMMPSAVVGTQHVPPGAFAAIGDNLAMSRDSRHWGWIPEQVVLGRAVRTLRGPRRPPAEPDRVVVFVTGDDVETVAADEARDAVMTTDQYR